MESASQSEFWFAKEFGRAGLKQGFFHALCFGNGYFATEFSEAVVTPALVIERKFGTASGFGDESRGLEASQVAVEGARAETDLVVGAAGDFLENGVAVLVAVGESDEDLKHRGSEGQERVRGFLSGHGCSGNGTNAGLSRPATYYIVRRNSWQFGFRAGRE